MQINDNKKGFIWLPILLGILGVAILGGGIYAYENPYIFDEIAHGQFAAAAEASIPKQLTACQAITKPGTYNLNNDVATSTASVPCIDIKNTRNVTLNCNNHAVSGWDAVHVTNVTNFSINNCKLQTNQVYGDSLRISSSTKGTITGNTIGVDNAIMEHSSHLTFKNNVFNVQYIQHFSDHNLIEANIFNPDMTMADQNEKWNGGIWLGSGSNNTVRSNNITGYYPTPGQQIGTDDGVALFNEQSDTITGNTIKNVFDCGIENTGFLFDTKIANNVISNAGFCGIGGWYSSSIKGNTISGNRVSSTLLLFAYFRAYGICSGDAPVVYFKDNVFTSNIITQPTHRVGYSSSAITATPVDNPQSGCRPVTFADIVTGNNVFTKNNFGNYSAPQFIPSSMIVDGGGNKCNASTTQGKSDGPYPIRCN